MGCVMGVFDWGVGWEESTPKEEEKVQEGTKLDCSEVTGALGVFA